MPAVLLAAGLALVSCRSTSTRYRFTPSPHETLVALEEDGPVAARVLIGIPGAEREGGSTGGHPELLVRLRLENKSADTMEFRPETAVLLGSDLAEFGAARSEPDAPLTVEEGASGSTLLRFPFPMDGDLDAPGLTGVNLALVIDTVAGPVNLSVTLERDEADTVINTGPPIIWGGGYYWGQSMGVGGRSVVERWLMGCDSGERGG